MMIILSDDTYQDFGHRLYTKLTTYHPNTQYVSVSNLKISTCLNCHYCHTKEYGKCNIKDDMQPLLYQLADCSHLILVGPISFGSYSSQLKKILDRLVVLGDPHYHISNGELVKGSKSGQLSIYGIGIKSQCSADETELFIHLVNENIKIMNTKGQGFVLEDSPSEQNLNQVVEVILNETNFNS